jgi:hypothetical protein
MEGKREREREGIGAGALGKMKEGRGVFGQKAVTPDFTRKTECISYVRQDHLHTHDRQTRVIPLL